MMSRSLSTNVAGVNEEIMSSQESPSKKNVDSRDIMSEKTGKPDTFLMWHPRISRRKHGPGKQIPTTT